MRFATAMLALAVSVPAFADGIDDRLAEARRHMADDDPAVREQGGRELLAVAPEAGSRLRVLLSDPDAEVRGRAAELFEFEGIVPEDGKTARVRSLLAALADRPKDGEDRAAALRELLGLHPNAALLVQRELAGGLLRLVEDPPVVVLPGRVELAATVVNPSGSGAWIRPASYRLAAEFRPFGDRPNWRVGRCGGVVRSSSLCGPGEDPADAAIRHLATLVRVPPGGRLQLASAGEDRPRCGALVVRLRSDSFRAGTLDAEFSGVRIAFPESATVEGAPGTRYILGEQDGKRASAHAYDGPEGRGLEFTAIEDLAAVAVSYRDPFWWVALAADGTFLASGAFGTEQADLAELKAGEKRRVAMSVDPPEGTATLWLGCTREDEEYVPAPLRLK